MKNLEEMIELLEEENQKMLSDISKLFGILNAFLKESDCIDEIDLLEKASDIEESINYHEVRVKERAVVSLALFQPAAKNLRFILNSYESAKIKERIGDLLFATIKLIKIELDNNKKQKEQFSLLLPFSEAVLKNFLAYAKAVELKNSATFYALLNSDIEVNILRDCYLKEIIEAQVEERDNYFNLILSVIKLERIADKIINLIEGDIFALAGDNLRKEEILNKQ